MDARSRHAHLRGGMQRPYRIAHGEGASHATTRPVDGKLPGAVLATRLAVRSPADCSGLANSPGTGARIQRAVHAGPGDGRWSCLYAEMRQLSWHPAERW